MPWNGGGAAIAAPYSAARPAPTLAPVAIVGDRARAAPPAAPAPVGETRPNDAYEDEDEDEDDDGA